MATTSDRAPAPISAQTLVGRFDDYTAVEPDFGAPFIDVDEWRETPRRHRYIHGGFENTHTLFSLYLPPDEQFGGRVLKHLEGGSGGHESLFTMESLFAPRWQFDFAFDEFGAILMESNQGHFADEGTGFHRDDYLFGASAESARFAKWLALKVYGRPVHHAYVFGASGGGHRSYQCLMHRGDVFAGGVPEVCGVSPTLYWSIQALAGAVLGPDLERIADACEPGGSDPFAGLTYDQREALADLLRCGYPRAAMNQLQTLAAPFTLYTTRNYNPSYFEAFWTRKGYLGHDDPDRVSSRRISLTTTIAEVASLEQLAKAGASAESMLLLSAGSLPTATAAARFDVEEPDKLYMADLTIKTGKAAGRKMVIQRVEGEYCLPFYQMCGEMFDGCEPGDEVEIDNKDWIAFNYLYKHHIVASVPGLSTEHQPVPEEYLDFAVEGQPVHVQAGPVPYDLNVLTPFTSKMIVIAASLDSMIWPSKLAPLDRYFRQVQGDRTAETYRLWWVENATHGPPEFGAMLSHERDIRVWRTRLVDYAGPAKQALLDVAAWAEEGIEPPRDSVYSMSRNAQLVLPAKGVDRGGIQPAVRLYANGGARAEVGVGEPVRFEGSAEVPPGTGRIVRAELDFLSDDSWPHQTEIANGESESVAVETVYAFDAPGTYFPCFRVSSWREGKSGVGLPIQNLARVRVVVIA